MTIGARSVETLSPRLRSFDCFIRAFTAGLIAGCTGFFSKAVSSVLFSCVRKSSGEEMTHLLFYVLLAGLACCLVTQVRLLNSGFSRHDTVSVVPVYQSTLVLGGIMCVLLRPPFPCSALTPRLAHARSQVGMDFLRRGALPNHDFQDVSFVGCPVHVHRHRRPVVEATTCRRRRRRPRATGGRQHRRRDGDREIRCAPAASRAERCHADECRHSSTLLAAPPRGGCRQRQPVVTLHTHTHVL